MKRLKFSLIFTLALTVTTTLLPGFKASADEQPPKIVGKAAITLDVQTGEIIYANNIDEKRYPASVTKLMTALLFAQNKKKTDKIPYTEDAKKQPAFALSTDVFRNIKIGDTLSADDTMKALLMFSANDSAYMIADAVGGSSDNFIKMMNDEAAKLSMKNTHFVTANGLDDSTTDHLTTAYDLTILARAAYNQPWVKEVMGTKNSKITLSNGLTAAVDNRNKLLGVDGNVGGKTGNTTKAGRCLVSIYNRNNRLMVGVVMGSVWDKDDTQVFNDMQKIIDWSYSAKRTVYTTKNTQVKVEKLQYKPLKFIGPTKTIDMPMIIHDDASYYANDVNKKELTANIKTDSIDPWNLSANTEVGKYQLKGRESLNEYSLYTTITSKDIYAQNRGLYTAVGVGTVAVLAIVVALIVFIRKTAARSRR
ncbi:D-alanyl-D-alanine carboxypeptidase [Clostridium sp. 19966]|uniref:D-alanyl-D-alanine carboxypeptidase family protein n=1 Tax=Clostridium sp. 19966 TaxID=2768166 RepID=UPI0028DDEC24|nr:D-alanyl-D-alanine carboxypeptidase family protein [Clostridium sp. 19966]MDT8718744.1 D-alanyl-D-alanine carboxypeptidase [Clostridium sp. 19966]